MLPSETRTIVLSSPLLQTGLIFRGTIPGYDEDNVEKHSEELQKISESSSEMEDICTECQNYGLEYLHLLECPAEPNSWDSRSRKFGLLKGFDPQCSMCSLFKSVLPEDRAGPFELHWIAYGVFQRKDSHLSMDNQRSYLTPGVIAVPSKRIHEYWREPWVYGIILPCRASSESSLPVARARILDQASINYGIPRYWIDRCDYYHGTNCVEKSSSLDVLFVIDCYERRLVKAAEGYMYVALSYVWGTDATNTTPGFEPDSLPTLITDSMAVTLGLGYRYLWVDRYCIPQTNDHVRHEQIRNMDKIYAHAQVTIIAACSLDASVGLTRVSIPAKSLQTSARIGSNMFARVRMNAKKDVQGSKWNSRGWTYQEGLLSTRRLVFTTETIYFQCGGGFYFGACHTEMVDVPFECGSTLSLDPRSLIFPGSSSETHRIWELIEEYSQKTLSFESDKLDAFAGILNKYENHPNRVFNHIWGVPIFADMTHRKFDTVHLDDGSEHELRFHISYAEKIAHGLVWENHGEIQTPGFPTWSWASCSGPISGPVSDLLNNTLEITLNLKDSRKLRMDGHYLYRMESFLQSELKMGLSIRSWVCTVQFFPESNLGNETGYWACFRTEDGRLLRTLVKTSPGLERVGSSACEAIFLGVSGLSSGKKLEYVFLVVIRRGDGYIRLTTLRFGSCESEIREAYNMTGEESMPRERAREFKTVVINDNFDWEVFMDNNGGDAIDKHLGGIWQSWWLMMPVLNEMILTWKEITVQ
ncbi:HET-domain-containing protein [Corynespora cassiicola Philippines]|uniref:HET-domain-containing protein n=1 Tax=Corynespora cassiicola Philippines TaxID=1448308 RepID=A0A2T2NW48_CORCC|nr:HET-domain-containing protein [Corynespora cassiicola Philippines]